MKKALPIISLCSLTVFILPGCALLQSKQISVKKTPANDNALTIATYNLRNGFPDKQDFWIAYSDRESNTTCISPDNNMPLKKLGFMDAGYIVEENEHYVKLIQYSPDIDLANNKGKLLRKTAKTAGWIKKDKLLLWQAAMTDNESRFTAKAITHLGGHDVLINAARYIQGDSLLLFNSPTLQNSNGNRIAPGSIVYLYKQSEDKKSYLVGREPSITAETARQHIIGWISKDAVTMWGTSSAFNFSTTGSNDQEGLLYQTPVAALDHNQAPLLTAEGTASRSFFENIFPVQNGWCAGDSLLYTGYMENIMDYSRNSVYNVLGNSINYNQFQQITKNFRKINVVFVLDASANNRMYFPLAKSIVQDLQLYFDTAAQVNAYRFGAVTYKQSRCSADTMKNTFGLTRSFTEIENYLDQKLSLPVCNDNNVYQPMNRGIADACAMLTPYKNETNIIVVIGTTGNGDNSDKYTPGYTISRITQVKARLLLFQSISKQSDAYNDFVLEAEKLVSGSATNIAELKKETLVDINDVIYNPSYSMRTGDSGIYMMDYPHKSMTQGLVLFPKKGEIMPAGMLKSYFDTLLTQVITDNRITGYKLQEYFYTIGVKNTSLKPAFAGYSNTVQNISTFNRALAATKNNFFITAYTGAHPFTANTAQPVTYGILLSETEYDRLMDQLYTIYSITASGEKFNARKACRRYRHFVKDYVSVNNIATHSKIKTMTLAQSLYLYTGFISADTIFNSVTVRKLKKQPPQTILTVFSSFKYAADAMLESKNSNNVKLSNNSTSYYYLNQKLMPQGNDSNKPLTE